MDVRGRVAVRVQELRLRKKVDRKMAGRVKFKDLLVRDDGVMDEFKRKPWDAVTVSAWISIRRSGNHLMVGLAHGVMPSVMQPRKLAPAEKRRHSLAISYLRRSFSRKGKAPRLRSFWVTTASFTAFDKTKSKS
jgi:hypothetical protein